MFIRIALILFSLYATAFGAKADTLKNDLALMLGQPTASGNRNWTDAQLYRMLNMAQDRLSARGRVIEKRSTAVGGTLMFGKPTGFIALRGTASLWRNGQEVRPIKVTGADSSGILLAGFAANKAGADEKVLWLEGDSIKIAPMVKATDSFIVVYYVHATVLDTNIECDYGLEWEQILLYEAKMIALEKIRDLPWYLATKKERDELLASMYLQVSLQPQLTGQIR